MSFLELFDKEFSPRLAYRAITFRRCFELLPENPVILETGCINYLGDYHIDGRPTVGHGRSTLMFDRLVNEFGGKFYTVDISLEATDLAASLCGRNTHIHCGDSVEFLRDHYGRLFNDPIDLLYLDSFDLDPADPLPAAQHGLRELQASWPYLHKGSVVCVDDTYSTGGALTGKGMLIAEHMKLHDVKKIMQYYQTVWVL